MQCHISFLPLISTHFELGCARADLTRWILIENSTDLAGCKELCMNQEIPFQWAMLNETNCYCNTLLDVGK
jgi:hypothetical protein